MSTRSRAVGAAVVVALALGSDVSLAGPASAHGACRTTTERVSRLTASARASCATARTVAAAYDAKVMAGGSFPGGPIAANGFRCVTSPAGSADEETFSVRCTGGRSTVRFQWGV